LGYSLARHVAVIDAHDSITGANARFVAWSLRYDIEHGDGICRGVEDNAYAVELTLERLVYGREILGGDILRVGVELGEYIRYCLFSVFQKKKKEYIVFCNSVYTTCCICA
jgi:hypothetical protein